MESQATELSKIGPERGARVIDYTFSSATLTILSIIQGVSLSILANNIYTAYGNSKSDYSFFLYSALSFSILIVIWYEYLWITIILRWIPTWMDAVIPFVLGAIEISLTFFITNPRFWLVFSILLGAGAVVAYNIRRRYISREDFEKDKIGEDSYQICKKHAIRCMITSSILAFIAAILFLFYCIFSDVLFEIKFGINFLDIISFVLIITGLIFLFSGSVKSFNAIMRLWGLKRI